MKRSYLAILEIHIREQVTESGNVRIGIGSIRQHRNQLITACPHCFGHETLYAERIRRTANWSPANLQRLFRQMVELSPPALDQQPCPADECRLPVIQRLLQLGRQVRADIDLVQCPRVSQFEPVLDPPTVALESQLVFSVLFGEVHEF